MPDERSHQVESVEAPVSAPATSTSTVAAPAPDRVAASAALGPYDVDLVKGASLYSANTAACHQPTGEGIPGAIPPLKGNVGVLDSDPSTQIKTVLNGLHGQNVGGIVYATPMPPFKDVLNDAQIADIINHERSSWGNQSKQITATQVRAIRASQSK